MVRLPATSSFARSTRTTSSLTQLEGEIFNRADMQTRFAALSDGFLVGSSFRSPFLSFKL